MGRIQENNVLYSQENKRIENATGSVNILSVEKDKLHIWFALQKPPCAARIRFLRQTSHRSKCSFRPHLWGHTYIINLPSDLGREALSRAFVITPSFSAEPLISGPRALHSGGKGQRKVETERGTTQVWETWQMVIKKVSVTDREVEKVSRSVGHPTCQSGHVLRRTYSLTQEPHQSLCQSPSLLFCQLLCHSVCRPDARLAPPVCQSLRVSESVVNSPVKASQD